MVFRGVEREMLAASGGAGRRSAVSSALSEFQRVMNEATGAVLLIRSGENELDGVLVASSGIVVAVSHELRSGGSPHDWPWVVSSSEPSAPRRQFRGDREL